MIYSLKYTDKVKEGSRGQARAWFIRIRPRYRYDKGLLEHEKTHVRQFWQTFGLHSLLYLLSKEYRLDSEAQAYKVQLEYLPYYDLKEEYRISYAKAISTKYGLKISEVEAHKLLM